MAQEEQQPDNTQTPEDNSSQLESGTYEIIRNRLKSFAGELRDRLNSLNGARKDVFGAIETTLLGTERVTTAHNCVPRGGGPLQLTVKHSPGTVWVHE